MKIAERCEKEEQEGKEEREKERRLGDNQKSDDYETVFPTQTHAVFLSRIKKKKSVPLC